jgi:hypothetical protein
MRVKADLRPAAKLARRLAAIAARFPGKILENRAFSRVFAWHGIGMGKARATLGPSDDA